MEACLRCGNILAKHISIDVYKLIPKLIQTQMIQCGKCNQPQLIVVQSKPEIDEFWYKNTTGRRD
jgi:hypothetical protein